MPAPSVLPFACVIIGLDVVLDADVTPGGLLTSVVYEWALTPLGPWTPVPATPPTVGPGVVPVPTNASLPGVGPIVWRVTATNADGSVTSPIQFSCILSEPTVTASPCVVIDGDSIELNATVNPGAATTTVTFEWGFAPGGPFTLAATAPIGAGLGPQPVSLTIDGLPADAPVFWRVIVASSEGAAVTPQQTCIRFASAPPTIPDVQPDPQCRDPFDVGVTVAWSVDPEGQPTDVVIRWGLTPGGPYPNTVGPVSIGDGFIPVQGLSTIVGTYPANVNATVYWVIEATNPSGVTTSDEFVCAFSNVPGFEGLRCDSIDDNQVAFSAVIDPNRTAGLFASVEWSTTPGGPYFTEPGLLIGGFNPVPWGQVATVPPGVDIYWRLNLQSNAPDPTETFVSLEQVCRRALRSNPRFGGFCGWEFQSCCEDDILDRVTPEQIAAAEEVAGELLWNLSGQQFGVCERTIRPCRRRCQTGTAFYNWDWWSRRDSIPWPSIPSWGEPTLLCQCGDGCSCRATCEYRLPRDTIEVTSILIDGVELPASAWRLDRHGRLLRVDGECWPECNDFNLPTTEPGTWSITYTRGTPVPAGGQLAGGQLVCEILKACLQRPCQLPARVQTVTRNGVTIALVDKQEYLKDRLTGIGFIDLWLTTVNPTKQLRRPFIARADDPRRKSRRVQ